MKASSCLNADLALSQLFCRKNSFRGWNSKDFQHMGHFSQFIALEEAMF
jgi:hypothetical protein